MNAPLDVAEVERWFREATGNPAGQRQRQPAIPPEWALLRILWVIAFLPPTKQNRKLQHAVANLKKALLEAPHDHPALVDLWDAARRAEAHVGPAPKQGGTKTWHVIARGLEECVRDALASVDRDGISINANGPLVKVICSALKAIDGEDHEREAVASYLRRAKGGRKK